MNEAVRIPNPALVDIDEAFERIMELAQPVSGTEVVPLNEALGRVTAAEISSPIDLPPFDNSAMDGFGLSSAAVGRAIPFRLALRGRIRAGQATDLGIASTEAVRVLTGGPVPHGVDSIVVEESCAILDDRIVEIRRNVPSGANIRRRGEDVPRGGVVVDRNVAIDARHIAILAACGIGSVAVRRRVRLGLLSTGDELRGAGAPLPPAAIYDANGPMLRALVAGSRHDVVEIGRHADDPGGLADAFAKASRNVDLIISSGGVSGSGSDHVAAAVAEAGGTSELFRLALKPGKPLLVGRIGEVPLLGLPGNPGSALVNFHLFGRPLLDRRSGLRSNRPRGTTAIVAASIPHARGRTEFMPARVVGREDDCRLRVDRITPSGPARLRAMAIADGYLEVPSAAGDLPAGALVGFHDAAALSQAAHVTPAP